MSTLKFSTSINAPKEKVWETLWNDSTYREWTSAFMEGSYAESDWNEGSPIKFLSPGGEGMYGVIEKKIPNEQMTFRHLGEIKNGVEEPKNWEGAFEDYQLSGTNGTTDLKIEMGSTPEFEQYLSEAFPKAMAKLKEISEK